MSFADNGERREGGKHAACASGGEELFVTVVRRRVGAMSTVGISGDGRGEPSSGGVQLWLGGRGRVAEFTLTS